MSLLLMSFLDNYYFPLTKDVNSARSSKEEEDDTKKQDDGRTYFIYECIDLIIKKIFEKSLFVIFTFYKDKLIMTVRQ